MSETAIDIATATMEPPAVLIVDDTPANLSVVVKSLEGNYGNVPGIAAATILGDGRVALILDVDAVVAGASAKHSSHKSSLAAVG